MQRNILTVFLASPGDLEKERNIVRTSVDRINKILPRRVGWHIELLGWEDTLPGYSRPQGMINRDVDSCDLFLGILWRRWGQDTGKYSSGFEEEFIRARERCRKTGKPEIWLFFKTIDEESMNDPGVQLKEVLKFKEKQIKLKKLFFKEFSDPENWEELIYDYILAYVLDLCESKPKIETQEQSAVLESSKGVRVIKETEIEEKKITYPPALISLFNQVNLKLKEEKQVSFDFWDRTRLFLQSSAWFSEIHLGEIFGIHELNLIYTQRNNWEISDSERLFIARSFIGYFNDNRPGWFWLRGTNEDEVNNLLKRLLIHDSNVFVRRGAINLLGDTHYKADLDILKKGLNDTDEYVIIEAISLIKNTKNIKYINLLEPFTNHKDSLIRDKAIEGKIELLYLNSPNEGFSYLIETETKIPLLLNSKIENLDLGVDDKLIIKAVKSSEVSIRRFCAKYLRKAKLLSKDICKELFKDPDMLVRKEGVLGLIDLDEKIEMDFIKKLFPEKSEFSYADALALALAEVKSDDFIPNLLEKRTPENLLSSIDFYDPIGVEAYKILVKKHFLFLKGRIRLDLDSEFETLKSESENKWIEKYGDAGKIISKKIKPELINFLRGRYIFAALDGLSIHGKKEDVKYAREYLSNKKYEGDKFGALKIILRFGDKSDIEMLNKIALNSYGETKRIAIEALFKFSEDRDSRLALIINKDETIYKTSLQMLLKYDLPYKIEIAEILLKSEIEDRRLDGLAILISSLNEIELEKFLDNYISQDTYFYNVVTWLDKCLYAVGAFKDLCKSKMLARLEKSNKS
jgi:HEAT repeat protein